MTQAELQARRMIETLKPAVAWARAHAGLVLGVLLSGFAALWLIAHDAHLRREIELQQLRRETATEVGALRTQAAKAMEEFRANARAIHDLESRRASLEREATLLRQKLRSLREEESVRVRQAETPGQAELSGRVTARPGPEDFGNRNSGVGSRESELQEETGNWKLEIGNSELETGDPNFDFRVSNFDKAIPDSLLPTPALDACREQSAVQDQLISNCEQRVEASQAVIDVLNRSVQELQRVVRSKDEIALRLDARHRAELQAARGSRLRRFGRALQYVGVGVVIGVVIAH